MTSFTPGPWGTFSRIGSDGLPEVIITGSNGCPLAAVSNHAEFNENARLISTAPELLEALEDALSEWEGHNGRLTDPTHPHWSNAARAIIANAEGGAA